MFSQKKYIVAFNEYFITKDFSIKKEEAFLLMKII